MPQPARPRIVTLAVTTLVGAALAMACGSESGRDTFEEASSSGSTDPGSSGGGGGSLKATPGADAGGDCTGTANRPGCACSAAGTQAPCWPGAADKRGVGLCKDGLATCEGQGEFLRWGACQGATLPGSKGIDAQCQSTCKGECAPGKVRWCDHPTTCNWAKQECLPNNTGGGSWGQCIETKDVPSACKNFITGSPFFYDEECCLKSNECCQVGGINSAKSDGNCGGITVTCN